MNVGASATLLGELPWDQNTQLVVFLIASVIGMVSAYFLGRSSSRKTGAAPPAPPAPSPKPSCEPVRLLAILQREGRLVDFLLEDVQSYNDSQIGAAVRDIHRNCRKALLDHLVLEPVLKYEEGAAVTVTPGFDPSAIRLTGNVSGQPPFAGTLRHHGWRVKELKVPAPPSGQDEFVVQPAEVEL